MLCLTPSCGSCGCSGQSVYVSVMTEGLVVCEVAEMMLMMMIVMSCGIVIMVVMVNGSVWRCSNSGGNENNISGGNRQQYWFKNGSDSV